MTTEAEMVDFLSNEVSIPFEEGNLMIKVMVVENFSETQSVIMFKSHHSVADGMSLIGLLVSMQDQYNPDQLYEFSPSQSFWKSLLMWICIPYSILRALCYVSFSLKGHNNALTAYKYDGKPLSGCKKAAVSE